MDAAWLTLQYGRCMADPLAWMLHRTDPPCLTRQHMAVRASASACLTGQGPRLPIRPGIHCMGQAFARPRSPRGRACGRSQASRRRRHVPAHRNGVCGRAVGLRVRLTLEKETHRAFAALTAGTSGRLLLRWLWCRRRLWTVTLLRGRGDAAAKQQGRGDAAGAGAGGAGAAGAAAAAGPAPSAAAAAAAAVDSGGGGSWPAVRRAASGPREAV
eukprot:364631-Chlamydomonas_euryale.AAC.6